MFFYSFCGRLNDFWYACSVYASMYVVCGLCGVGPMCGVWYVCGVGVWVCGGHVMCMYVRACKCRATHSYDEHAPHPVTVPVGR